MKCPHCDKEVALTWKRYWTAPMGKHVCPECGESFRLKHSLIYYTTIFSVAASLGLIFPLFRRLWDTTLVQAGIVYLIICTVILIPIDRWVDSRWRGTVKAREDE